MIVDQMDSPQADHNWWRLARAVFVAVPLGIAVWNPWRPTPTLIYERASALAPSDPSRARWMLRTAVAEAGGDFPDAQVQLCLLAIRSEDWDELDRLCEALRWQDAASDSLISLGFMATSARQIEPARHAYLELCRREAPYSICGLDGLANVYTVEQRPDQVLACREEITRLAPEEPRGWQLLAQAHEARGNPAAAAAAYRRTLEHIVSPWDEMSVRSRLVARLMDAGDLAAAGEELEVLALRGARPDRVEAHRNRLKSLIGEGAPTPEKIVDGPAQ